ncbi:MAG: glutathione S-transferase N-terminal domain-containing protein [Leptolyngbyaceae cyanobacterium]
MASPIDLYFWPTPNGKKISIMLEEVGLGYSIHPINILAGDQFKPEFLQVSPNNKIPAIVDPDGPGGEAIALFESGAILMYLAEKTGQLMPQEERDRYAVIQWLMFQMGGVGPMLGQAHHFRKYAPEHIPYAVNRYTNEAGRLYSVLDHRLHEAEYVGGTYSIADIAIYPWLVSCRDQGQSIENFPHVKRWFDAMSDRPAVQRGLAAGKDVSANAKMDAIAKENMFGSKQYQPRS